MKKKSGPLLSKKKGPSSNDFADYVPDDDMFQRHGVALTLFRFSPAAAAPSAIRFDTLAPVVQVRALFTDSTAQELLQKFKAPGTLIF